MPRIAAAAGALALIVFSVGVNIARYPRVWEMVSARSHLPQSSQASQPAAVVEPSPASAPKLAVGSTTPWQAAAVPLATGELREDDSPERAAVADQPEDSRRQQYALEPEMDGQGTHRSDAAEAVTIAPSAKCGRSARQGDSAGGTVLAGRLVPLVRPSVETPAVDRSERDGSVRRLPPVDQVTSVRGPRPAAASQTDAIPIYPGTGVD